MLRATICAGLLALGACRDAPRASDPAKEAAADPLLALDRHPAVAISIRQGTEHFADGVVTVTVRGDGRVAVDRLRAGTPTHAEKQVGAERVRALGRTLAEHRVSAPRTTSLPREPGDTPLVLRVEGTGAPFQADLWYGDRYQDEDLDAIIRLADALVTEVAAPAP